MNRFILMAAFLLGAIAVILGALTAHGLRHLMTPDQLAIFETGVRYQFYHVFALLILGILSGHVKNRFLSRAAYCFIIGILFFCGSLYGIAFLQSSHYTIPMLLGIITPLGGLFFVAGWLLAAVAVIRKPGL